MKKRISLFFVLAITALVVQSPRIYAQDNQQTADPKGVFLAQYAAIQAGDLETSLTYLDENYVSIALPPPPETTGVFTGLDAARSINDYLIGNHAEYVFTDIQVNGDTLTFQALLTEDLFRAAGIFPIKFSGTAVVKDGLIVSETWIMDKYDDERLTAALAREANKATLLRAYEEVFNKGNFDILEQDIAPDAVDHSSPDLQGPEAFRIPMVALREALPDLQVSADLIVAEGDLVMALATFTGTHEGEFLGIPPSGETVSWSHIDINRMENGQVVEAWHIGTEAMLQAFGFELIPPTTSE